MNRIASYISIILFCTSCAFTPQKARLSPSIQVASSTIGKGQSIELKVVDERPTSVLGYRGSAYGKGAEITTDQDVTKLIYDQVAIGLKSHGFNPISETAPKQLKIEVRTIEYGTSIGLFTGGIQITVALKGLASNQNSTYEKLYRTNNEERIFFVPFAGKNEEMLNRAINETLNKIFADKDLLKFLAD